MADDLLVRQLLEEILDSGLGPEEVCRSCPELLPQVRQRWQQLRLLQTQIGVLFPLQATTPTSTPTVDELPVLPGYEVQAVLGRGGMGVVYRAQHLHLDRTIAVKMLLAGPSATAEERARFLREARAAAGLVHPNIVQVHDVGDLAGQPFFTMEFVEGGSLAQKLAGTPQPARQAAALVATLADAVQAAHQSGIIHRDLKPANVLLQVVSSQLSVISKDGAASSLTTNNWQLTTIPKITDFGLARRLEGPGALTLSGVALGTPSYMAPEQARGNKEALGPGVDVYALGAILYECLTGRPPFRAETAAETVLQSLSQEPAPPSRLNARVPRDLETICLKCLEKDPGRRYASARALADDLRRFERGEPVMARRVGPLGRGLRWLRRRPALAAALAASLLLTLALAGGGLWWYWQRSAATQAAVAAVEEELREAQRSRDRGEYANAAAALKRAGVRLGDQGPAELHDRLTRASDNLELVRRLDAIRLDRVLIKSLSNVPNVGEVPGSKTSTGRKYEEAFRKAGVGTAEEDPAVVAARIAGSPVRAALVAALDDWAACAIDRKRLTWVLAVARRADPDPWRDRVRDPATWENREALAQLADTALVERQSPQLLAVLGGRLRTRGGDTMSFMTRVLLAHPNDLWVNIERGNSLWGRDLGEALGHFRAALVIRPGTAPLHFRIGLLYMQQRRRVEAAAHFEYAVRFDPANARYHNTLGVALQQAGRRGDAIAHFREAVRLEPTNAVAHGNLGNVLQKEGRIDEAIEEYTRALRINSKNSKAELIVTGILMRAGRGAELRRAWQKKLAANPAKHDAWFGYAELCLFLGEEEEYRRACRDLLARFGATTDPLVAERVGRACLLAPSLLPLSPEGRGVTGRGPEDEVRHAAALADRAVAAGPAGRKWAYPYSLFTQGLAEYRRGRFERALAVMGGEAARVMGPSPRLVAALAQHCAGQKDQARKTLAAAVTSYDWSAPRADRPEGWIAHILRREAEAMILPNLPAFLEGKYQPQDNDERLALLGACQFKDLRATRAALYAAAFAADPGLADDLPAGHRYAAIRAAAGAGCGGGADGARLSTEERARWRRQALAWLRAELNAWAKERERNPVANRARVAGKLAFWQVDPELAGLRGRKALDKLSPVERHECRIFWMDHAAQVERARPPI